MVETRSGGAAKPRRSLLRKWRKKWLLRFGSPEGRFTEIYRGNWWLNDESVSGPGSALSATGDIRASLPLLLKQFSVKTLLDAPCGDFNWMKEIRCDLDVDYIGADIVKELVARLQRQYGDSRTRFVHLDITTSPLPAADLAMVRDVFLHLSFSDARRAVENFARSRIEYLLASTAPAADGVINRDVGTGKARRTSLFAAPFHFPAETIAKFRDRPDTEMCLWDRRQILRALESR